MKNRDLFPDIKPEHAQAIGYVAASWSGIEEHLGLLIYQLLGLHTIPGFAVTAEISTLQRISLIGALLNLTGNEEWIEAWSDISADLESLRNPRNDAVHSTWQIVGAEHWQTRVKAKGKLVVRQGAVDTKALRQLALDIDEQQWRIAEFTVTVLKGGAPKIINQFHPPGWTPPTQGPSQGLPAQSRNPKRVRQQRRRKERRASE